MHEFQELEQAVLSELEPLKAEGLKTLEPYSGQFDADDLMKVTYQFPCIYVICGTLTSETLNQVDKLQSEISLLVGSKNLRGAESAARGDASKPGVYALLELARGQLHRQRILDGWTPPLRRRERGIVYMPREGVCLYEAVYELKRLA